VKSEKGQAVLMLVIVILIIGILLWYVQKNPGGGAPGDRATFSKEIADKARAAAAKASQRTRDIEEAQEALGR
jgi:hypothetical protein